MATKQYSSVGQRTVEGLDEAIAWSQGKKTGAHVTMMIPAVDVRQLRQRMGLSQSQFATRFGLPPGTLRNWEQGRSVPDAPTRVLLAVIAKHPEAVDDCLRP